MVPALTAGVLTLSLGLVLVMVPGLLGVVLSAVVIGVGTGVVTPVAFASLAAGTPAERLGQTMGAAELGRELGDAGGPLLVAGVAATTSIGIGFVALAAVFAIPAGAAAAAARGR
jgi:MFS family permease